MSDLFIVPDSSFFICFLDDIEKPQQIIDLLDAKPFSFFIGKITSKEIQKSHHFAIIEKKFLQQITVYDYFEYGEIAKMFFSESELKKGEHEVFIIAFILATNGNPFIAIIDDNDAKKFFKTNIPEKSDYVTGTVGFIRFCCCKYNVFIKDVAIDILVAIKQSKFYVPLPILDATIEEIRMC
jgi:predicted nucleic acid-binding protein